MTELLSCRCELGAGWCLARLWRLFGLSVPDRRRSGSVTVLEHLDTIDLPPAASRIAAPLRSAAIREADFTTFRAELLSLWNIQDTENTEKKNAAHLGDQRGHQRSFRNAHDRSSPRCLLCV